MQCLQEISIGAGRITFFSHQVFFGFESYMYSIA